MRRSHNLIHEMEAQADLPKSELPIREPPKRSFMEAPDLEQELESRHPLKVSLSIVPCEHLSLASVSFILGQLLQGKLQSW